MILSVHFYLLTGKIYLFGSVNLESKLFCTQVNADIKKYSVGSDGAPRLFEVDKKTVGQGISTKKVGSWRREDITHLVRKYLGTVQMKAPRACADASVEIRNITA